MSTRWSRDTEVVVLLATYRYLSASQIEALLFPDDTLSPRSQEVMTWRVLGRLQRQGLVAMTQRQLGGAAGGSDRPCCFLTTRGLKLAATLCPGLPTRRPAVRGTFLLSHSIATAETALAFRRAARSHPGHELLGWECDWQTAMRLDRSFVVPDARLTYAIPGTVLEAFVEVDLGTEGTRFFGRKVDPYLELYQSGVWREYLQVWPRVLTIAPTEARATAPRNATEAVLSSQLFDDRIMKAMPFGFCSLPDLRHLVRSARSGWSPVATAGTRFCRGRGLKRLMREVVVTGTNAGTLAAAGPMLPAVLPAAWEGEHATAFLTNSRQQNTVDGYARRP